MRLLSPWLLFLSGCAGPLSFEDVWVEDDGALVSVWGSSPEAVWTVGGQVDAGSAWLGHDDEWEPIAVPSGVGLLNWVHGSEADDVWVGGVNGALLHWNGAELADVSLGVEEAIWGVHAVSSDEVYAVGGASAFGGERARAWHFDGETWVEITLPAAVDGVPSLFKASLIGDEVWFVGAQGTVLTGREQQFTSLATGTAEDLVTVTSFGGEALVVGGRSTGVVYREGTGGLESLTTAPGGLFGVHDLGNDTALISGMRGYLGHLQGAEAVRLESPNELLLHAVWGTPGETTYAVGGNLESSTGPYRGTLLVARSP